MALAAGCNSGEEAAPSGVADVRVVRVAATGPVAPDAEAAEVGELQRVLASLGGPARVELAPGDHVLEPVAHEDPSCANCQDPDQSIAATRGLLVSGRGIRIVGAGAEATRLVTGAGYGVLFQDCEDCALERLTVTGGVRDPAGEASDAAVVVRGGRVTVRDAVLADNIGDPTRVRALVVGIMGLCVREGADVTVERCRVLRNSWDGVAAFRDARVTVRDSVIDGVDRAVGRGVGGGRGAGIGLTWNARGTIERTLVRNYWKGIGVFVDAEAEVRSSVVEDVAAWGIAVWDADQGTPVASVEDNVVFATGACGALVQVGSAEPGAPVGGLRGNVFALTGQDPRQDAPDRYCDQVALDLRAVPEGFVVEGNAFHANREADGRAGRDDVPLDEFRARLRPLADRLRGVPSLEDSRFLQTFGSF